MSTREIFPATMLRIHFGEADRYQNQPLADALIAKCQELGISGAIVYRGIEGYGASARIRHSGPLSFRKDAPMMMSIIDNEEKIAELLPALDEMVTEGLIVMSKVETIRLSKHAA